ncbi:hypothetical protein BDZ89DRAFT_1072608, partial [Hymenopellis radicata]
MHATLRSTCGIKSDVANKSCANTAFSVTFASSVHENNQLNSRSRVPARRAING